MPVTAFGQLTIRYDDRVLTPREWTARQSEWAAALAGQAPGGDILELCSGAGHIGLLALALVHQADDQRRLVCVDVNPASAELTTINAEAAGLAPFVEVRVADLLEAVTPDERFPLIIADPPWVLRAEIGRYPDDPLLAIDGGDDGLDVARRCLEVIGGHLPPGGTGVLQLGYAEQVSALAGALEANRLEVVEVRAEERGVLVLLQNR
ncbi:class I SAM-dependent methyltransferase [Nocardioides sp.]|uniref:class I SAM-dependent methyltransferase n=1 Tax=Nocardioides sp. TaxID=35761 RepID=UPI002ED15770